jgi:hypothetical protein
VPATIAEAAGIYSGLPAGMRAPDASRPVIGRLSDRSTFFGAISFIEMTVVDGGLGLTARITGDGILPPGGQQFTQTLNPDQLQVNEASTVLTVELAPLYLDALGMILYLTPVDLDLPVGSGRSDRPRAMLRWVAGLLACNGPVAAISVLVNRIVAELGLGR